MARPTKCCLATQEVTYLKLQWERDSHNPWWTKSKLQWTALSLPSNNKFAISWDQGGTMIHSKRHYHWCPFKGFYNPKIHWIKNCNKPFRTLKDQLSEELVLFHPEFTKPFIVQTSVSNTALGAVLSQEFGRREHPIFFLNKKFFFPWEVPYKSLRRRPCSEMGC